MASEIPASATSGFSPVESASAVSFGGLGIFAIFLMLARRNISAANFVQTIGGDKVSQAIDRQNAGNARAIVSKTDEGSRDKQAALHADKHSSVGGRELARRNNFLHQRIDGGPIHRGGDAGNQRHQVQMPKREMPVPGDVCCRQYRYATRQIERYAKITAVEAINQNAADEWDEQAWQSDHDNLQADFYGGMRCGHDVPAHAGKIHAAAEKGNKHGGEEVAEAALGPDERPINAVGDGCSHGTN